MTPERILVVDDEEGVRRTLQRILQKDGYIVEVAADGITAIERLRQQAYDLMLLDLNMQPVDGLQVLQAAREQDADMVVIVLTGHGSLENAVECLRLGAFDYLFKPASPEEIRQRVAAGMKHRRQVRQRQRLLEQIETLKATLEQLEQELAPPSTQPDRFLRSGPLTIDLYHRTAMWEGSPLNLTTTGFDILTCLVKASPRPLSPTEIVKCALGYEAFPAEARELVKWHIHHLRRKVEPDPKRPQYIKTVRGRGYLWAA